MIFLYEENSKAKSKCILYNNCILIYIVYNVIKDLSNCYRIDREQFHCQGWNQIFIYFFKDYQPYYSIDNAE